MDIKAKVTEVVNKISQDKALQELFMKDPVKAVEKVLGVDLPDDMLNPIIDGVKAKLTADKLGNLLGGLGKLGQ